MGRYRWRKNKKFGIHYPTGKWSDNTGQPTGPDGTRKPDEELADNLQSLEILYDQGKNHKTISINDAQSIGMEANIPNKSGFLLNDLQIPLSEIYDHNSNASTPFQTVSIGLEIEDITSMRDEEMRNNKSESGGGKKGKMGGVVILIIREKGKRAHRDLTSH